MRSSALWALCLSLHVTVSSCAVNITDDSYFFGQSPPVFPSPAIGDNGPWAEAVQKARAFVAQLSQEEKLNLTCGAGPNNGCAGYIGPIPRLGFEGMCFQDGSHGVHSVDRVNSYAGGISVGASWNTGLSYQRGYFMGGEFRTKGANVMLGPVVGPLGRVATGGRNWEGFSTDPYLSGVLASQTIQGAQSRGVITSVKHFIGNEQETNREPSTDGIAKFPPFEGVVSSLSSNIGDRSIHELYLWPFADAVRAGTGNLMISYNRINNSFATQNSKIINGLLKTELGYQGWTVSDWGAQHSGVQSMLAGLDMMMPSCYNFWGSNLSLAITNGSVPQSRLDDMVTRILTPWYFLGQDQNYTTPGIGLPGDLTKPYVPVNAKDPAAKTTILDGAIEGHVLVKNLRNALPLKKPGLLSIFGYDAPAPNQNSPSLYYTNGFEAAQSIIYSAAAALGIDLGPEPPLGQAALNGTLLLGAGSGANSPSYISSPLDALQQQAYEDDTSIFYDTSSLAPSVDPTSDACLVFINAFATEGTDRNGLRDDASDGLVNTVASACNNTIVVIHNAGIRLVDRFVDHPNVTAIIFAHLPGQDSGRAIAALLHGRASFSGKLPYTVAKDESDYGPLEKADVPVAPYSLFPQSNFTEGLYIDYRRFDAMNITPRYEFGFGLTYTTFSYSDLVVTKIGTANNNPLPTGPVVPGGRADLWDVLAGVDAQIHNTGAQNGQEVVQLYVGIPSPGTPVRQLRGFVKASIDAGGVASVHFDIMRRDLSVWDVTAQEWRLSSGTYQIYVGASSRDLRLNGTLEF